MADQSTIDAYEKIAEDFNSRNATSFYDEEFRIFKNFSTLGNKTLDIGCGTGRDAEKLIQLGFSYTGIDASAEMLKIACEKTSSGTFQIGNFYKLDFPDNTFDCFWAAASLLHVPKSQIDSVLQEIKRAVKPSGIGFISLKKKITLDEGYISESKAGGIERYFAFYAPGEFDGILERNGFELMQMTTLQEKDGTHWLCYFVKIMK